MIPWHLITAALLGLLLAYPPNVVATGEPARADVADDVCDPVSPPARSRDPPLATVQAAGRRGWPTRAPVPSTTNRPVHPRHPG